VPSEPTISKSGSGDGDGDDDDHRDTGTEIEVSIALPTIVETTLAKAKMDLDCRDEDSKVQCSRPAASTYARPTPRKPFDLYITSAALPNEPSISLAETKPTNPNPLVASTISYRAETPSFSRTRSILNLTSSALFGIYSPTAYLEREEPSTPWGTGAETPRERVSFDGQLAPFRSRTQHRLPLRIGRSILFFVIGMGYGVLVTHLHTEQGLAQFQVEGFIKPSYSWNYLVFWGVASVSLGSLLPWVDTKWEESASNTEVVPKKRPAQRSGRWR
jgi:hypothetical protein